MRNIDTIVVHCTATRPQWWEGKSAEEKVREVRDWHVSGRGWSDIGYHLLIDRYGTVVKGRPIERAGAHARGHNATSIGIALFGGHGSASTDKFEDHFTPEQDKALRSQIDLLQRDHRGIKKIIGHNEVAAKACPGFQVGPWLKQRDKETSSAPSAWTSLILLITSIFGGKK